MILIRSSVYFILMALTALLFGLTIMFSGWFGAKKLPDVVATAWGAVNLWLLKVICNLKVNIQGLEFLPDRRAIIMAKHQSTWETISLRGLLPPHQSWILKKELLSIPVFGKGLKLAKSIPIDRAAGRRAVIQVVKEGMQRLNEDRLVIVFPEGTRTAPGERRKYGLGGAVLAEKSGVAVIPIAHNAGVYWARRGVKKYPGTIELRIGPPIASQGRKAAEIMADVENWIEQQLTQMPITRD